MLLKFDNKFSARRLSLAILSYGASRLRNSDIVPDDARFSGVGLCFFRVFLAEHGSSLGSNGL